MLKFLLLLIERLYACATSGDENRAAPWRAAGRARPPRIAVTNRWAYAHIAVRSEHV
jgi:hypothetical protein